MRRGPLRGAVHWAVLDKRRPVIVLSPDERNALAKNIIVVPCSTSLRAMSWHVLLQKGEGGLPTKSIAKCEQVTTIDKDFVSPAAMGERLSPARLREIEQALWSALGFGRY